MVQKGSAIFLRTCSERRADCHHSQGRQLLPQSGPQQVTLAMLIQAMARLAVAATPWEKGITQPQMCWDTHFSYLSGPPSTLPHTKTSTSDSTPVLRKLVSTYNTIYIPQYNTVYFVWKMCPDKGFCVLGMNTEQTLCDFKVISESRDI